MLKRLALTLFCGCWFCWPLLAEHFVPPSDSVHQILSFNAGWKFLKGDSTNAHLPSFDDSAWTDVAAPHTYNDRDSYTDFISHSSGDRYSYAGVAWYRKRFRLPLAAKEGKVLLEFEGLKQAGHFWVNGRPVGKYENGVTPLGLDLTRFVHFGAEENLIAVKVDNSTNYRDESTGTEFQWMGRAFNPNYGGLNRNIRLHLTGKVYQTLPLYENLQTTGIYVYASHFDIKHALCDVEVESQVRNESSQRQSVTLSVEVVDAAGNVCARFASEPSNLVKEQTAVFHASGKLVSAKFWSDERPTLYHVYCLLTVGDRVVDFQKITTGFRKAEFRGGVGAGGLWLNERFVWLTGYAQRSVNDWAGLGQAYPDWMHDYNAQLVRSTHANHIRWMHIAPQPADVRACDRAGLIEICPAGDKEKDVMERQWEQRKEVMRNAILYFRNSPSILFWEAGNNSISPEHMREMVALRKQFDPNGDRAMGCRTLNDPACTPIAEYFGIMVGQDPRTDRLTNATEMFRAYSAQRRDGAPLIEA
ncbi:MAG TPA: beta galactosidase jelly roll domain-containing protein, partial [Candidatus Dormibacteraeota bacterium]|nr:beta galactosidase jelly roll domain-containing protein [Candidatus Dormibacteraeota bacterium]